MYHEYVWQSIQVIVRRSSETLLSSIEASTQRHRGSLPQNPFSDSDLGYGLEYTTRMDPSRELNVSFSKNGGISKYLETWMIQA
jgi:hypothetical protein